jgi:hypothetical protein
MLKSDCTVCLLCLTGAPGSDAAEGIVLEPFYPHSESKTKKLWGRLEDAYEDPEKLEALILEILHDQPTILAAAVDSEFGHSIRQATVMKAVWEARPMLNLMVGILSKYVPPEAWNREVKPMCDQLQTIFGKPGLFCGHAQGAKELKAAELVRNPPENATQRKGRDGRTPKGDNEGVVSMYGKRLLQSCRCDSSKCLKMYCTCFRNETRCNAQCVCLECHNDGMHEEERMAAARAAASQIKKPRIDDSKLQAQAALLAAAQDSKKAEKERKKRGRAYTKAQIKMATKFVLKYEKKFEEHHKSRGQGGHLAGNSMDGGDNDGHKSRDIPRTGTFENEAVWATFCVATGEVNHRAVNLWDRVQREMKKAPPKSADHLHDAGGSSPYHAVMHTAPHAVSCLAGYFVVCFFACCVVYRFFIAGKKHMHQGNITCLQLPGYFVCLLAANSHMQQCCGLSLHGCMLCGPCCLVGLCADVCKHVYACVYADLRACIYGRLAGADTYTHLRCRILHLVVLAQRAAGPYHPWMQAWAP